MCSSFQRNVLAKYCRNLPCARILDACVGILLFEKYNDMKTIEGIDEKGRKVAIDLLKANIFAVAIMIVAAIVLIVPFFLIWGGRKPTMELIGSPTQWTIVAMTSIVGIVLHELIHGITWASYAPSGWKSISFGVMWKMLTPYCHCDEPMHISGYMMGAMMPCVVLGVIPSIVALFIGNLPLLAWGVFFISAAAGDIWMTWLLTKENPKSMVLDHPSEAGFYIID